MGRLVTNWVWAFSILSILCKLSLGNGAVKLKAIRKIGHAGYSEGLHFDGAYLWNAVPTEVRKIDPKTGEIVLRVNAATGYSEGVVVEKQSIWNLSFEDNGIYKADLPKSASERLTYKKIGSTENKNNWGLEKVGKELALTGSFGGSEIFFYDSETGKKIRVLKTNESDLEDLAWDGKALWTSSFRKKPGMIFKIDIQSGKTLATYEIPEPELCPVIDGLAFETPQRLWITGKECPAIWLVQVP